MPNVRLNGPPSRRDFLAKDCSQTGPTSDTIFLKDCATNYLIKNFWHNYVHDRLQRITDANYRLFRHEARYFSDFEADNFANILLPLSYDLNVAAAHSTVSNRRPEIANLYGRNRCNTVFIDRAKARKDFPKSGGTYENLQDWEWLIRRRFANQLTARLIENNRAVSSVSMHFFGDIKATRRRFTRPDTGAAIELNGVRITFEDLGDIGSMTDDDIRKSTGDYVARADVEYTTRLRQDPALKKYALDSLRAKCEFLVGRSIDAIVVGTHEIDVERKTPRPTTSRKGNKRTRTGARR